MMKWEISSPTTSHARLSRHLFRDQHLFRNSHYTDAVLDTWSGWPTTKENPKQKGKDNGILSLHFCFLGVNTTLDGDLPKPTACTGGKTTEIVIHPTGSPPWSQVTEDLKAMSQLDHTDSDEDALRQISLIKML